MEIRRKTRIEMMLESKHYPRFMYLAIVTVLLLIFLNFVNIINQANEISLSGFAIKNNTLIENQTMNNTNSTSQEIYSQTSYMAFYGIMTTIILTIALVFSRLRSITKYNMKKEQERIWE
jgi:uncharacterized membrane protein